MLQCVAARCSALQCVAVRCDVQGIARRGSVFQCGAVRCSALRSGAVRCSALQSGAVRCSALQSGAVRCSAHTTIDSAIDFRLEFQIQATFVPPYRAHKSTRPELLQLVLQVNLVENCVILRFNCFHIRISSRLAQENTGTICGVSEFLQRSRTLQHV